MRNPENQGFYGAVSEGMQADNLADRGSLLTARVLWVFSSAFQKYRRDDYLNMARYAYRDLISNFRDPEFGGFWWSTKSNGTPTTMRKLIYGQAFAIYSLSEYHKAIGDSEPLGFAIETFKLIEKYAADLQFGGYLERFTGNWSVATSWQPNELGKNVPKTQNTHLHLLEAYTRLYETWPDHTLRQSLRALSRIFLHRIFEANRMHLGLYFTNDWRPIGNETSYGHDLECSWLLTRAAASVADAALKEEIEEVACSLAKAALEEGIDNDGGLITAARGGRPIDRTKLWWVQSEGMVGFLNAYALRGDYRYLNSSLTIWDFIESRLIDRVHGEWFAAVDHSGIRVPGKQKAGFWKCPYHNGRACLEMIGRLRSISSIL